MRSQRAVGHSRGPAAGRKAPFLGPGGGSTPAAAGLVQAGAVGTSPISEPQTAKMLNGEGDCDSTPALGCPRTPTREQDPGYIAIPSLKLNSRGGCRQERGCHLLGGHWALFASVSAQTPSRIFPAPPRTRNPALSSRGNAHARKRTRGGTARPVSPTRAPPARRGHPARGCGDGRGCGGTALGAGRVPQHRGSGPAAPAAAAARWCWEPAGQHGAPVRSPRPATETPGMKPPASVQSPPPGYGAPARYGVPQSGTELPVPVQSPRPGTEPPSPVQSPQERRFPAAQEGGSAGRDERRHHRVNITKSHLLTKSDLPSRSSSPATLAALPLLRSRDPAPSAEPGAARWSRRSSPPGGDTHTHGAASHGRGGSGGHGGRAVGQGAVRPGLRPSVRHSRPGPGHIARNKEKFKKINITCVKMTNEEEQNPNDGRGGGKGLFFLSLCVRSHARIPRWGKEEKGGKEKSK